MITKKHIFFCILLMSVKSTSAQVFRFYMFETSGGDFLVNIDTSNKRISVQDRQNPEYIYSYYNAIVDEDKGIIAFAFSPGKEALTRPDHTSQYFILRKDAIFCSSEYAKKEYYLKPISNTNYENELELLKNTLNFLSTLQPEPPPPPPPPPPLVTYEKPEYDDNNEIYYTVDESPEFPGGMDALMQYLQKTIKYPPKAQLNNIQGRCVCKILINKYGFVRDVQITKSLYPDCDAEAIRVFSISPRWKPGRKNGKNVDCYFVCPVLFKL